MLTNAAEGHVTAITMPIATILVALSIVLAKLATLKMELTDMVDYKCRSMPGTNFSKIKILTKTLIESFSFYQICFNVVISEHMRQDCGDSGKIQNIEQDNFLLLELSDIDKCYARLPVAIKIPTAMNCSKTSFNCSYQNVKNV